MTVWSWAAGGLGIAVVVVVLVLVRRSLIVVTIEGRSMEPTFVAGDRVLARRRRPDRCRTGDVVVMAGPPAAPVPTRSRPGSPPSDGSCPAPVVAQPMWTIKRVVAVAGEPVPRDWVPALATVPEAFVPVGKVVLLGDGPISVDSRQYGYVDADRLVAIAVRRLGAAA